MKYLHWRVLHDNVKRATTVHALDHTATVIGSGWSGPTFMWLIYCPDVLAD
jgi:hypothetical protein